MKVIEGETPLAVADLIEDIIKDKKVCDLGCGVGTFMTALDKYSSEVIGIEDNYDWAMIASKKGFRVITENIFSFSLPEADVYYCWNLCAMGIYLKAKWEGTKGTFIFGHTVRKPLLNLINSLDCEVRTLPNSDWKVYITQL
ncbi:hypothetical protein GW915_00640 [bacterium]|nr:hypothetical protein [bacterium]